MATKKCDTIYQMSTAANWQFHFPYALAYAPCHRQLIAELINTKWNRSESLMKIHKQNRKNTIYAFSCCVHTHGRRISFRASRISRLFIYIYRVCCVSCVRIWSDDVTSLIIFNMRQKTGAINSARIWSLGDPFERWTLAPTYCIHIRRHCRLRAVCGRRKRNARHGFKWKKQFRRTTCFKKRFTERETNPVKKKTTGIQPLSQISGWNDLKMTSPRMRHHTVFPLRQQSVNRLRQCRSFHLISVSWKLWYARVVCVESALPRHPSLLTVRYFVIVRRVSNLIDNEFYERMKEKEFLPVFFCRYEKIEYLRKCVFWVSCSCAIANRERKKRIENRPIDR